MVGQEILVLFIMVRIRAPQPPFASVTPEQFTRRSATRSFNEVWQTLLYQPTQSVGFVLQDS